MAKIYLEDVSLDYPLYNVRSFSLRQKIVNVATGGRILKEDMSVKVVRALSNINLKFNDGDRVGVIGHNGAGKTTLLRCLSGIYQPTDGKLYREGSLGTYIEIGAGLEPELTGYDNITRLLMLSGIYEKKVVEKLQTEIIDFSELNDFIMLPVRTYSAGMQTRLVFSTITAKKPDIIIIDEFFGAGDVEFQKKASKRLMRNIEQSSILVLASHDTVLLKKLCNRFIKLTNGCIQDVTNEWNGIPVITKGN